VITRYATSVDQRDMARYATCFTDDVEVSGFTDDIFTDRDTYVAWVGRALERFAGTHHQVTNQEIDVDVDGDRAHMRSYVQATHEMADDPDTLLILWAIYDDRLVRTADGWSITHHALERLIPARTISATRP
jgi:ketosteroid isomerase-like protein